MWLRFPFGPGMIFRPALGPLAQSVEHLTFNQVVAGSIPARPTNKFSELLAFQPEIGNGVSSLNHRSATIRVDSG